MSSSLDALLKLSKTSSPLKLFDYVCITLYILYSICTIEGLVKEAGLNYVEDDYEDYIFRLVEKKNRTVYQIGHVAPPPTGF